MWKRTHFALDWSAFKSLRNRYYKVILESKKILRQLKSLHLLIIRDVSRKLLTNSYTVNLLHLYLLPFQSVLSQTALLLYSQTKYVVSPWPIVLHQHLHNILLTRLSSWFGIQGTAINWFRSYLSCRCFRVKCNNNLSSLHTCLCGVHKAQFLALYSLSCIQPHSVLSSHLCP